MVRFHRVVVRCCIALGQTKVDFIGGRDGVVTVVEIGPAISNYRKMAF